MIVECHSRGDRRYSAMFARLPDGRTIEEIYQAAKRDADGKSFGGKRQAKGKTPTYLCLNGKLERCTPQLRHEFYRMLWDLYFHYNPQLLPIHCSQFRDIFSERGKVVDVNDPPLVLFSVEGGCNQARAIAQLVWIHLYPFEELYSGYSKPVQQAMEVYLHRH